MEWKNHYKKEESSFNNNWLITYSDMITIVLCFFIVFFTFTAKEASMLENIKESLSDEVEDLSHENKELKKEQEILKTELFGFEEERESDDFLKYLEERDLADSVEILDIEKGLMIRFKDKVIFDSGSADISNQGYILLDKIGMKIKGLNNSIRIEGHTDNKPINNLKYPSNWELSIDRAVNVGKYLINEFEIEDNRITISGRGEQNPIADNSTEEGRAKNRRIEITILN